MKTKLFILMINLCLLLATEVNGGEGAAAFLKIPVGARAAAMGGASIAVANDASAVYWNPAALGSLNRIAVMSSALSIKLGDNGNLDDIESKHYYLATAVPIGRFGVIGLAWKNFSIGDIEIYDDKGYSDGRTFEDSENAFFLAYGIQLVPNRMSVGASVKFVQQKFTVLKDANAMGQGISIGMTFQATYFLKLALRTDNNFRLHWDNGHKDEVLFRGIAGFALSPWRDNVLIAFDLEQIKNQPLKANCGVEFSYVPKFLRPTNKIGIGNLAIRGGLDDLFLEDRGSGTDFQKQINFTYGLGLGLLYESILLNFNYSFGSYIIGNHNRFTLSLLF